MLPSVRSSRLLPLLVAALVSSACYSIEDIDRTQPNKVNKSLFEGEWYYHQTIVDVPYATWFTFIGEQTEKTELITWDIQEQFLIAYRSYDMVAGTDRTADLPGDHGENTPIAIFPIVSHFDIQRDYNPATGEQTNVLVENTWDRPWYERDYIRVDWANNLAPTFHFLVGAVQLTPFMQVPGAHFVQDPDDPNALLVGQKNGAGGWQDFQGDGVAALTQADYIDVVHRVFAQPQTIFFEDWYDGTIYEEPACWYYGNVDCAAAEVTIRSSFMKASEDRGYEPKPYPDNLLLRDDDGDTVKVSYADRDSLTPDPNGFEVRVPYFDKFGYFRTERERYDRRRGETQSGQILLINRFDIWEDAPACVDESSATPYAGCTVKPIDYYLSRGFPADIREQAQITADGWNVAFKETVRALKYGDGRSLDEVEDVFILHDNTFAVADDGTVTDRGQRIGDIRYNLLAWVEQPDQAGLLGYGPSAIDPLTGQILSASAFIYGGGVDSYAERGKDIIELMNDPDRMLEYIYGDDVKTDVYLRAADDPSPRERTQRFVREKVNTPRNKAIRQMDKRVLRRDGGEVRARLDAIRDTPLEDLLMNDRVVRAFSGRHGPETDGLADGTRGRASPANWAMGQAFRKEKVRQKHLASRNVMHTRAFDPSIIGIADSLKDTPPEEIWQTLRERVFRAVAEHEVGHNLGLRHNFEASSDALNYGRDYWDLRGEGAQPLEPLDDAQLEAGIREHQYSSIMDYGSRFMSDIAGLGEYDRAAIAFGYGDLVWVFDDAATNTALDGENLLEMMFLDDILRNFRHYTKLPEVFGGVDAMHNRRLVPYQQLIDQMSGQASWNMWEVPFRFCSDEYESASATCAMFDEGADPYEIANAARTQYLEYFPLLSFARDDRYFDEWSYMSNIWFRAYAPMLTQYQNWVFDSFLWEGDWECIRDDIGCDLDPTVDDPIYFGVENVPWAEAGDAGLPGAAAARLFLDTINEVIAMPEPGSYYYSPEEEVQLLYSYGEDPLCPANQPGPTCSELNVPFGMGRYTDSTWDADSGYYFFWRLLSVGSFYDKLMALEAAVTSSTYFLGVDTGADLAQYAIGLNLMFPEEVYKMVGGASSEDYPTFAGVMCNDDQEYLPPVISDANWDPCGGGAQQYVDPATSFTVELYAIWYGMAFLQDSFDTNFNDRLKIWLQGSGEAIEVTDPALLVTFTNPLNNRTYVATRTADPTQYSPGAAILQRAQRFADLYTNDPSVNNRYLLEALVSTIEDIRGTYDIYGYFWF
jgi:hypothetical protein